MQTKEHYCSSANTAANSSLLPRPERPTLAYGKLPAFDASIAVQSEAGRRRHVGNRWQLHQTANIAQRNGFQHFLYSPIISILLCLFTKQCEGNFL
jgi:hypothetical protein